MNKGFTLIELLVVVLIIGILAAIALPQYTKAVERSRMAEAAQHLGDIATAQSVAFLQDGSYFALDALNAHSDVQLPDFDTADWSYQSVVGENGQSVTTTATRLRGAYKDGTLVLTQNSSGAIGKNHGGNVTGDNGTAFAAAATSMGYPVGAQAGGGN